MPRGNPRRNAPGLARAVTVAGLTRPAKGEVLHFSEDSGITLFVPHIAPTASQPEAYVWAVDSEHSPSYWFPRDCPRILTWATPRTSRADRERFLGVSARVHAIEFAWLAAMQSTELYAYRFDRSQFRPFGSPEPHAYVATEIVRPLGPPEKVGPLLQAHAEAGIELRLFANLWPYWTEVTRSTLGYSGIRLRNAQPAQRP